VCGGLNHGVGLRRAAFNTQEIAFAQIREWAKDRGHEGVNLAMMKRPALL